MRLKDKVAIVTGGSRGIGLAIVEAFLREGAAVVLTASRKETAEAAVEKLRAAHPGARVEGIWPDLSSLASVQAAFADVAARYGRIDILANNAGVSESTPFLKYDEATFDRVMNLNVKGVFTASRAAAEQMVAQGGGVILNTSSMVSIHGQPSGIAYPTSKFAVNGFTLSLARELAPKGVRVNAVAPGVTATDMVRALPAQALLSGFAARKLTQPLCRRCGYARRFR